MAKLRVSDVAKQDLDVLVYLLVYGGVSFLVKEYLVESSVLSLILGGAANYVLYRVRTELKNKGYRTALKGK